MSINELFCTQILSSYNTLVASGSIPRSAPYSDECMTEFNDILNGESVGGDTIARLLLWYLDPILKARKKFLYSN